MFSKPVIVMWVRVDTKVKQKVTNFLKVKFELWWLQTTSKESITVACIFLSYKYLFVLNIKVCIRWITICCDEVSGNSVKKQKCGFYKYSTVICFERWLYCRWNVSLDISFSTCSNRLCSPVTVMDDPQLFKG